MITQTNKLSSMSLEDREISSKIMDSSHTMSLSNYESSIYGNSTAVADIVRQDENSSSFDSQSEKQRVAKEAKDDGSHMHPTTSTTFSARSVQSSYVNDPAALEQLVVTHQKSKQAMSIGQILDSSNTGRKRLTSIATEDLELASPIADFILGSPLERL